MEPISDEDLARMRSRFEGRKDNGLIMGRVFQRELEGLFARLDQAEASLTSAERRATQANDPL